MGLKGPGAVLLISLISSPGWGSGSELARAAGRRRCADFAVRNLRSDCGPAAC